MYVIGIKIHSQKVNSFSADIFVFKNRKPVIKVGAANQISPKIYQLWWDYPKLQYWIKRGVKFDDRFISLNFSKRICYNK